MHVSRWDSRAALLGLVVWVGVCVTVCLLTTLDPEYRSLAPLYKQSVLDWQARQPLYVGPSGMNYLPPFVLLYLPFDAMGFPDGDCAWRLLAAGLLAWGLWRLASRLAPDRAGERFLGVSFLSLLVFVSPLRYGQANAHLAGAMVCAIAMLLERRWWPAAAFLALGVWFKPLGVVLLLLAPLAYPAVALPGAVLLCVMLALPFAIAPADYVAAQYTAALTNLQACSEVTTNRFANLQGMARGLGGDISPTVMRALMVAAAVGTAALSWVQASRLAEPRRAIALLTLAATYLMLFNPMNEGNSFGILSPAVALVVAVLIDLDGRRALGWACAALLAATAILPEALRRFTPALHLWLSPVLALAVGAVVVWLMTWRWPRALEPING